MTHAETKLAELTDAHIITRTGHSDKDDIFAIAGPGTCLTLVESDAEGYPLVSEKWDAVRYPDGSMLIVTYVRGNRSTYYWKAIAGLDGFEIWDQP